MSERLISNPEKKKGMSVDECVKKSKSLIQKNGMCLFIFDVKGSRKYLPKDRQSLQYQLKDMIEEINTIFDEYFPENNLTTIGREEKGFYSLFGDGSCVGINNSDVIPKLINFINEKLPEVKFNFGVVKDGYDKEFDKLLK